MIPLEWYLVLAAALFCTGLYGVLSRRNAVAILMGVELMLNGVNINLVAAPKKCSNNPQNNWTSNKQTQPKQWAICKPPIC